MLRCAGEPPGSMRVGPQWYGDAAEPAEIAAAYMGHTGLSSIRAFGPGRSGSGPSSLDLFNSVPGPSRMLDMATQERCQRVSCRTRCGAKHGSVGSAGCMQLAHRDGHDETGTRGKQGSGRRPGILRPADRR
jgi:hypothetical protein